MRSEALTRLYCALTWKAPAGLLVRTSTAHWKSSQKGQRWAASAGSAAPLSSCWLEASPDWARSHFGGFPFARPPKTSYCRIPVDRGSIYTNKGLWFVLVGSVTVVYWQCTVLWLTQWFDDMPSLCITDQVISIKDDIFVQKSICLFTPLTHMAQKNIHIRETVTFGAVVVFVFLSVLMLMIILLVGSESFQHQCSL